MKTPDPRNQDCVPLFKTLRLSVALLALAGTLPTLPAEIARRANDFVESIGINTHLDDDQQYYDYASFGGLGVRHFRDNSPPDTARDGYRRLADLYNGYGIRCTMCYDNADETVLKRKTMMENAVYEAIEGVNEPDLNTERSYFSELDDWGTRTYAGTIAYQIDLYTAMKGDSATSHKPVLSPPMAYAERSRGLRGCYFDAIAMHSYDAGVRPTAFYLDATALPSAVLMNAPGSGSPPAVLTETGWRTPRDGPETISDLAGAKYVPRVMAECFNRGILRTYLFEMCDFPTTYNYGLIRTDGTPKPAHHRLKNLIALLGEGSWDPTHKVWSIPSFQPGELDYTMSGATPNVHHLLLQKSNGDYYLLLWQEVSSYDVSTGQEASPAPVSIELAFNSAIASASVWGTDSLTPIAGYSAPRKFSVAVPDEIVIVKLAPDQNPAVTHPMAGVVAPDAVATLSNSSDTGQLRFFRTGDTGGAMTVNYTLGGSAGNGTHYQALPASVVIPSGTDAVNVSVTPAGLTGIDGRKTLIATLGSGSYSIGPTATTAAIKLPAGNTCADDFEDGNLNSWNSSQYSSLSITGTKADEGSGALKWTFVKSGTNIWSNEITLNFSPSRDLSSVSSVRIRFAEDPANPEAPVHPNGQNAAVRQPIYFDLAGSNGSSVSGGAGVIWLQIFNEPAYRTIVLPLGAFPRNEVSSLKFYVNGSDFPAGTYVWYLDDITFESEPDGVVADFEDGSAAGWTAQSRSILAPNTPGASAGLHSLKWTYQDDGTTQWNNQIYVNFPAPLDLTHKRKLVLRFHSDASNPTGDAGQPIYFDMLNNGASTSNGSGVASWNLAASTPGFHTVELDLGSFARDKVNSLSFYVNGNTFATGDHIWYLDSLTLR